MVLTIFGHNKSFKHNFRYVALNCTSFTLIATMIVTDLSLNLLVQGYFHISLKLCTFTKVVSGAFMPVAYESILICSGHTFLLVYFPLKRKEITMKRHALVFTLLCILSSFLSYSFSDTVYSSMEDHLSQSRCLNFYTNDIPLKQINLFVIITCLIILVIFNVAVIIKLMFKSQSIKKG